MTVYYSKHARQQMVARGVSSLEVEEAIKRGSKQIQNPGKILAYYRYFCVVYKKTENVLFIITVKPLNSGNIEA